MSRVFVLEKHDAHNTDEVVGQTCGCDHWIGDLEDRKVEWNAALFSHIAKCNLSPPPHPSSPRPPLASLCLLPHALTMSHCFCLLVGTPSSLPLHTFLCLVAPLSSITWTCRSAGRGTCCFVFLRFHTFQILSPDSAWPLIGISPGRSVT